MKKSTTLILAATTAVLAACNAPDANRTTKAPPGVNNSTAVTEPLVTRSAPPAPAMRDQVAPSANVAAPGTDAAVAFAHEPNLQPAAPAPSKDGAPDAQARAVDAQEAAAKAPDTASADAAKADVKSQGADGLRTPGTGTETSANSPRHGDLTKGEESNQMPKAGQANNYSSTALEEDSGRGRKP
jgi:hypothetical protein